MVPPLLKLMTECGTDKAEHRYDIPYGYFFKHRREDVRKVLEIGVKKGASLRLWEEYFPQAKVYGIDIDPTCKADNVFIGSQLDPKFMQYVAQEVGTGVDLIVDDGAHLSDAQLISMTALWPCVRSDHGIYAIEDLHAHLKTGKPNRKFRNSLCKYPPFGNMVQQRVGTYFKRARCKHESPGVCCFPGIVFFIKTGDVPPPSFENMRKKRSK